MDVMESIDSKGTCDDSQMIGLDILSTLSSVRLLAPMNGGVNAFTEIVLVCSLLIQVNVVQPLIVQFRGGSSDDKFHEDIQDDSSSQEVQEDVDKSQLSYLEGGHDNDVSCFMLLSC